MEEKKGTKVSLTTAILFFLLIFAAFGIALIYEGLQEKHAAEKIALQEQVSVLQNEVEELAEEKNTTENPTEDNRQEGKIVNKIETDKEFVYTIYESKQEDNLSYIVPKINIDSEYAKTANKEIEEEILEPLKSNEFDYGIVDYNSYINYNVLSLVVKMEYKMYPGIIYKVYNISLTTGEKVDNKEILEIKNLTEEEYLTKLQNSLGQYFIDTFGENGELHPEIKNNQYKDTISRNNYSIENQIFIDNSGKINVVARVYQIAGAEYTWVIVKI